MLTAARATAIVPALPARRLCSWAAALAMGVGLTACGGGSQVSEFKPNKIVSFGDELSVIGTQTDQGQTVLGQKHGINFVYTDQVYYTAASTSPVSDATLLTTLAAETYGNPTTYSVDDKGLRFIKAETSTTLATNLRHSRVLWDCASEARLWIQILANGYGLGYASQCPADRPGAVSHAAVGAKSTDVIAQINAHKGELTSQTLVTVWAGQNDILEQLDIYRVTPGQLNAIKATLKARGEALGKAVNGMLSSGARVLVVTPPDLGKAPGARSGEEGVLREMAVAFNDGFTGINGVINNGNKIGLVKAYDQIKDMADFPQNYGLVGGQAACDTSKTYLKPSGDPDASKSLYNCSYALALSADGKSVGVDANRSTLVAGATPTSHLWASEWVLAPGGQARIGSLAYTRATENPF